MKQILNAYLPPLLWAALIFFLSAQTQLPGFEESWLEFGTKKLAHMIVYGILYFLIWRAGQLRHQAPLKHWKYWLVPLAITLLYAISDEYHQSFVSGRTATVRDVGFDLVGASGALFWLRRRI